MTRQNIVASRGISSWQPKTKRKRNSTTKLLSGFFIPRVLIVALACLAGGVYLYSINSSAVKGYQIKQVEKEISELKKENETLRIQEAELNSLRHIEESSKEFNMAGLKNISYVAQPGPVARR